MKKLIPFKREIKFNNNIEEIVSISLEHNIKNNSNELVGELIISGEFKEVDDQLNVKPFIYNIPLNIDLDDKYNIDNLKIDIDNFEYEIINNILSVDISILLTGLEEKELDEEIPIIDIVDEEPVMKEIEPKESIFNDFDSKDNYITYHVHIYRENDDINSILNEYKITKEELEEYNDLSNITLGSKLIIPSND